MKVADVANVSIVIKVYFGGFVQPICKNRAVFLGENGLSGGVLPADCPQEEVATEYPENIFRISLCRF